MAIETYQDKKPQIGKNCFIADSADLIGEVVIGDNSSIWHSAVIRADIFGVVIGSGTSIQDNSTVHVNHERGTYIGNNVTVGHNVVLHACTVEDGCMIGIGSVILDGATIGEGSIVAAGSVVAPNKEIPPHSMVMGIPGQVVRELDEKRVSGLLEHAEKYVELAHSYFKK